MALATSAFTTFDAIGRREDLTDYIYDISPTDTPFLTGMARGKATNTLHEWQTDALAAAVDTNAALEGDEATTDAATPTVRLTNQTQISDKVPRVTGSLNAANSAGRRKEMAYQIAKRGKELKRDMEKSLLANKAKVAGDATTARVLAGVEAWTTTNTNKASDGTDPTAATGVDPRNDGTQRKLRENFLKEVLRECFDAGGEPDCIMAGPFNKQQISTFTGNSTRTDKGEDSKLVASVDVYKSDFGELKITPNRFQRSRSVHVFQLDMWACSYYRPMATWELAKTGDSERHQILCEYTLEARNEAASGIIADLTTS